ncbi:MAG: serine/threonine-protein kinase [Rhodanobacteraceae bacterium]
MTIEPEEPETPGGAEPGRSPASDKERTPIERDSLTVATGASGVAPNKPVPRGEETRVTHNDGAKPAAQRDDATRVTHNEAGKRATQSEEPTRVTQNDGMKPGQPRDAATRVTHNEGAKVGAPADGATRVTHNDEAKKSVGQRDVTTHLSSPPRATQPSSKSRAPTAASAIGRSDLPEAGQIIKSRFELVDELGRGGMGAVFRARDLRKVEAQDPNQWVAIKFLSAALDGFEFAFVSLQREAKHAQTLNHPNIVKVFDFDRDESLVYLTMEVLEGESLQQRLRQSDQRPLDAEERSRIACGILAGVSYAHSHDITHADLKPSNVMVSADGEPKVLDFGIARGLEHDNVFDADDIGALTVDYASPEMLAGERPTPADDVYALGCIVYALHAGKHPFDHLRADQARELRRRPGRPRSISRVQWRSLRKALAFTRAERHPDAAAFLRTYRGLDWRRIGIAAALVIAVIGSSVWFLADPVQSYLARSNLTPQQTTTLNKDLHDGAEYLTAGYGMDSIPAFAEALSLDPYNAQARAGINTALDQARKSMPAADYRDFLMGQARETSNPDWIRDLAKKKLDSIESSR